MLLARRIVVALGLLAYAVLHGSSALGWTDGVQRGCAAFWSIACMVGAVSLLRPTFWARRYCIGIGIAGLLNAAAYFAYFRHIGGLWFGATQTTAFAAIVLLLSGKKMRALFDERASHWRFDHPTMHMLAAALSFNVAGVAMLVYYATLDEAWTTPGLRAGALVTAVVLAAGTLASTTGRIFGLFVMTLAGLASLGLGWLAYQHAHDVAPCIWEAIPRDAARYCREASEWMAWGRWETIKSVVGFVPAAVGSLLCFGVFLGPMIRFVRNRAGG